ncbi:MAG: FGGY-family carbohydrate kinase [Spirochaetales bacterium]|uniref:FGGY-family carbohydrate kinase n=1 Tax=Candidatus Thalassospirochaeta sargassi TaxID=3119039 RepID=A0AAJ1MJL9_9SPIO|nr:FGGY-family carbohydrate kinase [Spirochaetales bacterium]
MDQELILSHNLGTTGNLAVVYDTEGKILKSWFSGYKTEYRHGNIVEQDANSWWRAVCESTRGVLNGINEKSINSVSFSGQMMGCLCIDKDGIPLANSIIWADMRAENEAEAIHAAIDEKQFYSITGHRISPSYTLSKLLWIKNNNPEIFRKTAKVIQAKDFIIYKMTGNIVTDYSDASGTNMFDLNSFEWSDTILSISGISKDILPEPLASTDIAGTISIEAAAEMGLLPGTPVVTGAGDGLCSNIGAGCITQDDAFLYLGTSAWIGLTKNRPHYDDKLRTFNWAHLEKGKTMPCGTMQAAGNTINWINSQIAGVENIQAREQDLHVNELIDQSILNSPPGAKGLMFMPYLSGERSPHWNPDAAGVMLGLKMDHSRSDFFRASFEGIAMNLKLIMDSLVSEISAEELIAVGALTRSLVKKQILANVLNIRIVNNNHSRDSKSFGAALIGGIGTGVFKSISETGRIITRENPVTPEKDQVELYRKMVPIFHDSYENLKTSFKKISSLNGGK